MEKIYNVSNMSVMVAKWSRNYKLLLFTLFALSGLFGVNEKAWGAVNRSWNAGVAVSQGKGTVTVTIYKHDWWSPDNESKRTIGSNAQKSANSSSVLTATDSESRGVESSISYRSCVYTVDGAATGYSWLGWYDGSGNLKTTDQTYKPWTKTKANKDESYYAKFSKNSYDVTLAPNGGSGNNQTIRATFDSGMPSKLKSGSTIVKPTKTGYTFTGYFDATSGGTKYYNADLTSARNWDKASTGVTLYAQWSAIEYTITLTAGTGTTSAGTKSIKATFDASTNLTSTITTPTKAGNVFDGYYTGANGSGTQIIDAFGNVLASKSDASYTYTDADKKWKYAGNIELHANWIAKYDFEITGGNYKIDNEAWTKTEAFAFVHADEANMTTTIEHDDVISYNRSSNTITAKKIGTSKITFTQNTSTTVNNGTIEFTITVDSVANTLAVVSGSPFTRYVDQEITSVRSGANSNGTITTSSSNPNLAYYDVDDNTIYIPNSDSQKLPFADVTITISQAATAKYKAKKHTIKLKVQKYANTLKVKNSTNYSSTILTDSYDNEFTFTATNEDYNGSPIQVTQTAGTDIATYFPNDKVVYSSYKLGTATWSVSQAENYKYKAGNCSFSVTVVKASENTCYVLENQSNTEKEWHGNTCHEHTWNEENVAGELKFDISKDGGLYMAYRIQQLVNGNWQQTDELEDYSTSWQTKTFTLNQAAKGVRFYFKGGSYSYVRNVSVKRKTYVDASDLTIDKTSSNNPVYPSDGVGVDTLPISYSLANGGNLKIANDNPKFTISPSEINVSDCNGGSANISIQYKSSTAGTDVAHLVIYNDVYRKEVTLTGITAKRNQTITWNVGNAIQVLSEIENAASVTAGTKITYSTNNPDAIAIENGKLVAKGVGEATITVNALGNEEYNAVEGSKTITVTSDLVQQIIWNQSLLGLRLGDEDKTLNAYATSDVSACTTNKARAITYSSSNEDVVKIVNGNKLRVVSEGIAYVKATQAGGLDDDGHTYMAVTEERKAIVRDPSALCEAYAYQQTGTATMDLGWNWLSEQDRNTEIALSAEPDQMTFRYKFEKKPDLVGVKYGGGTMYVEQYINGWSKVGEDLTPLEGHYQTATVNLDSQATKVRICAHGVGYHSFTDCQISMLRYIETSELATFESKVGQEVEQNMTLRYSNITGPITLTLGHTPSNFSVSTATIEGSCGDHDSVNIIVKYTPTAEIEEEAELLRISDGVTNHDISLNGSATVTERYISWDIPSPNSVYTIETVNLTAQALTTVGHSAAGSVFYTKGELSTTGNLTGSTLTFSKDGVVYIAAQGVADPKYSATDIITKQFNVSKTPTTVDELPTTGTIYGGTAAEDVGFTGGSAKNTVNNGAVTGLFKVTSPATLNAGTHDLTIEFTPENKDMYIGFTTTLKDVTVSQITPEESELGVTVDDITCGQRIDEAILTNTGSLAGTWYWVDEETNHATPVAGTYDDLNVYFVPSNTNYATVNSTVSVNVNKLETLNVPVALSFCAGGSETFRGTEYTEAGEYNVPATGATRDTVYNVTVTVLQPTTGTDSKTITYGDSESWNGIDLSGYAVGSHEVEYHTTNAVGCDSTVTLSLTVNAPIINEYIGTGDWNEDENWSSGSKPDPKEENPDIIVTGTLVVKDTISVGSLTIKPTGGVVIIDKGVLVVNDATPEQNDGYGDLRVADDGALQLNEELKVRDFTLDAKLAGKNEEDVKEAAASGQVKGNGNLDINGEAYFQMTFDPKGKISFGWYDFVVPFPVNISDGIYRVGSSDDRLMVSGVDFLVQEFSESRCANKQKSWTNFSGTMQPGRVYTITFNYSPSLDQNVFVFKKASGAALGGSKEFATQYTAGSGSTDDFGWNGLGNSMLQHGYITGEFTHMQVYNHAENKYDLLTGKNPTFAIGTSFFVQVGETAPKLGWTAAEADDEHPLYAPRHRAVEVEEFLLSLRKENQVDASDHLYISGSEEATEEYVIGHDLRKMGTPTEAKAAQMWATKGGKKLCDIESRLVDDNASSDLNFYAPQAGLYELTVEEVPQDANLYLTFNGEIIWDLTASPYLFELTQGTTKGYGLRIEVKKTPAVTTGVEDVQGDEQKAAMRKVLIDNKVYIVTPEGKMYNIIGKGVKF